MIADLKPYSAYIGSNVKWLGKVPEHWETLRLGNLLRERGEVNSSGNINQVLSVLRNRGVIPYSEKGNIGNKMSEDITRYKVVRPNDIVVNCMNVIIGSVGLSCYTGCLSPVYYVLTRRSEDDDPRYLNAYFQTKPFQDSLVRIGNGILAHRMRIPMELLKCEPFPRPPSEEQTAIARYLDHIGRRINRYVQAKQKLIALLEEQKQAIIQEAVTGRIDVRTGKPYAAYKDSGVEWLGEVPEHWKIERLKVSVSNIVELGIEWRQNDLYLALEHVESWTGKRRNTGHDIRPNGQLKRFQSGDVLFGKLRPYLAKVTRPNVGGLCVGEFLVLRPRNELIYPHYLEYLLRSKPVIDVIDSSTFGAKMPRADWDFIGCVVMAWPVLSEQTTIVRYLDEKTSQIDSAITQTKHEIELLREYQQRLTSDVVTGKLDVREAAAKLPPEEDNCSPADSYDKIPDHQMPHDEIEPDTNGAML